MKLSMNQATCLEKSSLEKDLELCEVFGYDFIEPRTMDGIPNYLKTHTIEDLAKYFQTHKVKPLPLIHFAFLIIAPKRTIREFCKS